MVETIEKELKIDDKDWIILKELQNDCRQNNQDLSKKLDIPPQTLGRRIKRLEDLGIIKKYTAVLDPEKVGLPSSAIVLVRTFQGFTKAKGTTGQILKALNDDKFVSDAHQVLGRYDFIFKIRGKNEREIGQRISDLFENYSIISNTETYAVMKTEKEYQPLPL